MTDFKIDSKDVFFILKEQLNYGRLCALQPFRDLNEKSLDLLVNEAMRFAKGVLDPLNFIAEEEPLSFADGKVHCPDTFKDAFRQYGENGWIAAVGDPAFGGQGFPLMMRIVINEMMYGACQSFNSAPSLTFGAARLIHSFGTETLKQQYVSNMFSGTWSGTMCLTEPGAGSNLAALETTATPEGNHFRIIVQTPVSGSVKPPCSAWAGTGTAVIIPLSATCAMPKSCPCMKGPMASSPWT